MRSSWAVPAAVWLLSAANVQSKVHKVTVGNGGFRYNPNTTYADVGDIIEFEFFPPNHSVIRAQYTDDPSCPGGYCNPCVPWTLYNADANQSDFFFSGLRDVNQDQIDNPPSWNLTVNDTQPIFFYCNAPNSCHPNGMVGVINPAKNTSLERQFEAAENADYQLNPGDSFPAEGTVPTTTGTPIPANDGNSNHSHLSGGAIAGIVIGALAAVILGGLVLYFCGKSRAYSQLFKHSRAEADRYEAAEAEKAATMSESGRTGTTAVSGWVAGQDTQQYKDPNRPNPQTAWSYSGSNPPMSPPLPISPKPEGGQFTGYNRQTGEPEFAVEAPYQNDQGQIAELEEPQHAKPKSEGNQAHEVP